MKTHTETTLKITILHFFKMRDYYEPVTIHGKVLDGKLTNIQDKDNMKAILLIATEQEIPNETEEVNQKCQDK